MRICFVLSSIHISSQNQNKYDTLALSLKRIEECKPIAFDSLVYGLKFYIQAYEMSPITLSKISFSRLI